MAARRRRSLLALAAAVASALSLVAAPSTGAPTLAAPRVDAPGGPGDLSRFDLARKDCVGTARNGTSKVWFTVADGVLSDVYEPTIDNSNVQSMQFVVTDGSTFTDLQQRDMTYTVSADDTGMACTVVARSAAHGYTLTTTYVADPVRDSVVSRTVLTGRDDLQTYVRLDAHVNGNGGGGAANGGADDGSLGFDTVVGNVIIGDTGTTSEAANRDYAVPTFMALKTSTSNAQSVGYAGTASDGLVQLDADHRLATTYDSAPDGHVVGTVDVTQDEGTPIDVVLGFGRSADEAFRKATRSGADGFPAIKRSYLDGWRAYDARLTKPATHRKAFYRSANVLKASEDKTFPGAIVASLASPWGQAVSAGDLHGGQPVYFGSYREIFARDLYESATGLIAAGDVGTAKAAARFLFTRQQQADGRFPRNSLLNGKSAPDTGGDQLDETAYPILLASLTGVDDEKGIWSQHVRPAADFLVAHGPAFGNERWEEQSGYSPSTIAAEIAGLVAAARTARRHADPVRERLYLATADHFQRMVKSWTLTTTGPHSPDPYFVRLTKDGDPDAGTTYGLGNGSVNADQRSVVDGGFQELVRLGLLKSGDADVANSLAVLDAQIRKETQTGTGYYRYGIDATDGSVDGYGDCWVADPTNCPRDGQPWPTTNSGSGQLWPVLSGERGESAVARGDDATASDLLDFMVRSASGVGLVPEQVWGNPDLAADPYGTDPTTASIGFRNGQAAGSASPLSWAQAQLVRLIVDLDAGRLLDRPAITKARYVDAKPPAALPVTITSPTAGATVQSPVVVTGQTAPSAKVTVASTALEGGGTTAAVSAIADRTGAFSASVPAEFGADVITVGAATASGTGYAQVKVEGDLVGGASVLDTTDPSGDDNGPGTFQYPTAPDFHAGAFDLTRFQVVTKGDTVYLRTTLRDLTPTFGSPLGAQLLDLYVREPGVATTSTAAAYPSRNYAVAADSAWTQRIEVQGFAAPVWVDADGTSKGTPAVSASADTRTITVALPAAAFGTPAAGWTFALALHGQDGFSADQARGFQQVAQDYQFGLCPAGGTAPVCSIDPGTAPKLMDTITPAGVDQATELDPTVGPVALNGVAVP